jgi:eukaryotic-like serine/threonine-protein kinase
MKIVKLCFFVFFIFGGCKNQEEIEILLSDDESVYVGDIRNLYSFDATTGKKRWNFECSLSSSSPIYDKGIIYCRGIIGVPFYGIDAKTGLKKREAAGWNSNPRANPIVYNDHLFQLNESGNILYALNLINGFKPWLFKSHESTSFNTYPTSPTIKNGIIYVIMNHKLFAIDAQTGSVIWINPLLGNSYTSHSTPLIFDGIVYVTIRSELYAIDISNGQNKWILPFDKGFGRVSTPIVNNGTLYINSQGYLYAIDAKSGVKIWQSDYYVSDEYQTPFYKDGLLYTSRDNTIFAADSKTGFRKWTQVLEGKIAASPTVSNGTVYIGTQDGIFYAINSINGKIKWEYSSGISFESSAFVLTKKGEIIYSNVIGATD